MCAKSKIVKKVNVSATKQFDDPSLSEQMIASATQSFRKELQEIINDPKNSFTDCKDLVNEIANTTTAMFSEQLRDMMTKVVDDSMEKVLQENKHKCVIVKYVSCASNTTIQTHVGYVVHSANKVLQITNLPFLPNPNEHIPTLFIEFKQILSVESYFV